MSKKSFDLSSLASKVDELIIVCDRLRLENEKLRAENSRLRARDYGSRLNQRTTYRNIKGVVSKVKNLEEKI